MTGKYTNIRLHIGSKRYSSWSLRPWLVLKYFGIPFEEVLIPFENEPGRREFSTKTKAAILAISSSGRMPSLKLGASGRSIHDSLAICETVAELSGAHLWPRARDDRAFARSISSELHSQFIEMRKRMPMCCGAFAVWEPQRLVGALDADIARLEGIIQNSAAAEASKFLFGEFSIADAMMSPYMLRLHYYSYPTIEVVKRYITRLISETPLAEWMEAGTKEEALIPDIEALVSDFPETSKRVLKL